MRIALPLIAAISLSACNRTAPAPDRSRPPSPSPSPRSPPAPSGAVVGVGIRAATHDRGFAIGVLYPGGAAAAAGLRVGDVVTAVDGEPTARWSLERVAETLRGAEGSTVALTVERDGASRNVTLTRRAFQPTDPAQQPAHKPGAHDQAPGVLDPKIRQGILARLQEDIDNKLGRDFPADKRARAAAIENKFYDDHGAAQERFRAGTLSAGDYAELSRQQNVTRARAFEALLSDEEYRKLFGYGKGSVQ